MTLLTIAPRTRPSRISHRRPDTTFRTVLYGLLMVGVVQGVVTLLMR